MNAEATLGSDGQYLSRRGSSGGGTRSVSRCCGRCHRRNGGTIQKRWHSLWHSARTEGTEASSVRVARSLSVGSSAHTRDTLERRDHGDQATRCIRACAGDTGDWRPRYRQRTRRCIRARERRGLMASEKDGGNCWYWAAVAGMLGSSALTREHRCQRDGLEVPDRSIRAIARGEATPSPTSCTGASAAPAARTVHPHAGGADLAGRRTHGHQIVLLRFIRATESSAALENCVGGPFGSSAYAAFLKSCAGWQTSAAQADTDHPRNGLPRLLGSRSSS